MSDLAPVKRTRAVQIDLSSSVRQLSPTVQAFRRFLRRPSGIIGLVLCAFVAAVAVFAPLLAPFDPIRQFGGEELHAPSASFVLGTDSLGRDILSRIIFGTRTSLLVGVLAVALGAGIGATSGIVAGFAGGPLDAIVMRVWDAAFSVPAVLVGIGIAAVFGAGVTNAAIALGIATMPTFARIARSTVIRERYRDYVQAAFAIGATSGRILLRHIVPNTLGPLVVQVALAMAAAVLLEAGLSFLGLGTQPPAPSWGGMLAESRQFLRQAPWFGIYPGLALTIFVLGLNFFADGLRDALDPRST